MQWPNMMQYLEFHYNHDFLVTSEGSQEAQLMYWDYLTFQLCCPYQVSLGNIHYLFEQLIEFLIIVSCLWKVFLALNSISKHSPICVVS